MLLVKSLLLVCSAVAVMAQGTPDAIVAGALFVGKDTTSAGASPADIFRDPENHAAAAASILMFSASSAKYHPSEQNSPSLLQGYSGFTSKAKTFPGFIQTTIFQKGVHLNGSFTQLEKEIRENYDSSDAALIARSLRDLIPGFVQDKSLVEWLLSLMIISKPDGADTVTVKFVELLFKISSDKSHTTYIPEQTATLSNTELNIIPSTLSTNADQFGKKVPIVQVPAFVQYFTSPKTFGEPSAWFERDSGSNRQQTTVTSRHRQYPIAQWMMRE
ncbi:hypothetical protein BGX28_003984 [Mortierella sp. GBA30]|nr:hypothetical protein BGX28_003984 [Mortierella sp. GBA30]